MNTIDLATKEEVESLIEEISEEKKRGGWKRTNVEALRKNIDLDNTEWWIGKQDGKAVCVGCVYHLPSFFPVGKKTVYLQQLNSNEKGSGRDLACALAEQYRVLGYSEFVLMSDPRAKHTLVGYYRKALDGWTEDKGEQYSIFTKKLR